MFLKTHEVVVIGTGQDQRREALALLQCSDGRPKPIV
jgi:hypothetical protein